MASRATVAKRLKDLDARAAKAKRRPWDPLAALCGPDGVPMVDVQRAFLDKRDRTVVGTRQGAKSTLAAVDHVDVGLMIPGSETAFVDFDITHAEKIILRDFERLLDEFDIAARIVGNQLQFRNGSVCYLFSGEPSEVVKLQGLKLALLTPDESQDCGALGEIFKMVRPALMRYRGRISAMGIPGRVQGIGFWWDITEGDKAKSYGQHRVHMDRNPWLPEDARLAQRQAAKEELGETSPDFMRHWDGEWPPDDENALRCVRYFPAINGYDGDPPVCRFHSLGLDPGGTQDPEGVVVVGWGNTDTRGAPDANIYAVAEDISEKREGGDWDNTGARVGPLENRYRPETRFLDYGSAKKSGQIVQYQKDQLITLDAVPDKNPDAEFLRLSILFQARRLWVKKGSKLEHDLLKTTWDPKSLAAGAPKVSRTYKPTALDAFRAAMWGVEGYAAVAAPRVVLNEAEAEAAKVRAAMERRPRAETVQTAGEKILGTAPREKIQSQAARYKALGNPYGLPPQT